MRLFTKKVLNSKQLNQFGLLKQHVSESIIKNTLDILLNETYNNTYDFIVSTKNYNYHRVPVQKYSIVSGLGEIKRTDTYSVTALIQIKNNEQLLTTAEIVMTSIDENGEPKRLQIW